MQLIITDFHNHSENLKEHDCLSQKAWKNRRQHKVKMSCRLLHPRQDSFLLVVRHLKKQLPQLLGLSSEEERLILNLSNGLQSQLDKGKLPCRWPKWWPGSNLTLRFSLRRWWRKFGALRQDPISKKRFHFRPSQKWGCQPGDGAAEGQQPLRANFCSPPLENVAH